MAASVCGDEPEDVLGIGSDNAVAATNGSLDHHRIDRVGGTALGEQQAGSAGPLFIEWIHHTSPEHSGYPRSVAAPELCKDNRWHRDRRASPLGFN